LAETISIKLGGIAIDLEESVHVPGSETGSCLTSPGEASHAPPHPEASGRGRDRRERHTCRQFLSSGSSFSNFERAHNSSGASHDRAFWRRFAWIGWTDAPKSETINIPGPQRPASDGGAFLLPSDYPKREIACPAARLRPA
jgi:hypothetical protein